MDKHLLIVNGHPDPRPHRFCAALCDATARGAEAAGWRTRLVSVGDLALSDAPEVPVSDWDAANSPQLDKALADFRWAQKLAIVFPLLLDAPPPLLCKLLTRAAAEGRALPASVVVTMSLPGFLQRANYRAGHNRLNLITLPGVKSGRPTFIGCVETISDAQRRGWLTTLQEQQAKLAA